MYLYKQIWVQFFCVVFLRCFITEVRYKQKESSRPLLDVSVFWIFFYPLGGRGLGTENFEVLPCYGGGGGGGIRLWRWSLGCHESFLMSHRPKFYHHYFIRNFIEIPSKSLFISSRMSLQTLPCPVLFLVPDLEEEWGQVHKKNNFATKSVLYVASKTILFNAGRGSFNFCFCLRGVESYWKESRRAPTPSARQSKWLIKWLNAIVVTCNLHAWLKYPKMEHCSVACRLNRLL